jgi:chromosome partitioning protein
LAGCLPANEGEIIMRTICLLAQKGGTGKTTLCLHLAVLANELGRDAVILDMDPQASSSAWRRRRQLERPVVERCEAESLAQRLLELEQQGRDLVLLDTAPHSSHDAATAVALADLVLIASRPAILDLEAIGESVKIAKRQGARGAVVLNACPPPHRNGETAIVREAREAVAVYGLSVSPVSLSQRAAFSHALIDGHAVTEFESHGKAAAEMRSLWDWIETQW